jgi:hypothetical protein
MNTSTPCQSGPSYESIKLGIDAHAKYYWVSPQVDGTTSQPVQKMTSDELLLFVVKLQRLTNKVVCPAGSTMSGSPPFEGHDGRRPVG